MKRSMIALGSAGAITLALGGYAVGATRHDGASERSATCEQANQDFEKRAGQFRKQKQRAAHDDEYFNSISREMESTRVKAQLDRGAESDMLRCRDSCDSGVSAATPI
ncbi:hypothetical protein [Streptomyces mirabilis]|uniref:hypothetical protein n=1 Tax=Streptomyces mirabilis TaxID=68239 RepID=UPI0036EB98F7